MRSARPRGLRVRLTLLIAAIAVLLLAGCGARERRAPGPPPKVFAFVSSAGGEELRRLERLGSRIDVVAPNWYALDPASGRLRAPVHTQRVLAAARRGGVEVWPVVNALTGGSREWEPPEARERIAVSLLAAASGAGASGVTLDMEELRPEQRDAFTALVREAAARLHAARRRLAVYVPRPGPGEGAAYDWAALAGHADLVLSSGYNEHWAGSEPGPTTTSRGFAEVVDRALEQAGPAKAVPVLGAFGYRWPPGGRGELIASRDAQRLRPSTGTAREDGWERFGAGADTVVYETTAGLRARAAAARASGAHWIGLFSLGREPAAFWDGLETARDAGRTAIRHPNG